VQVDQNRRSLLRDSLVLGVALGAAGIPLIGGTFQKSSNAGEKEEEEPEVTATEDLMREHGVIRRALLVYIETVPKLRQNPSSIDAAALRQAAQLFRTFGEDYHERMLEEQHIFPVIQKQGGELKRYAEILTDQHNRGREIRTTCWRSRTVQKLARHMQSRSRGCWKASCSCTRIMRLAKTRLSFQLGRRIFRTSNWTKSLINLRRSSTRCLGRTASKMPRKRSATLRPVWG